MLSEDAKRGLEFMCKGMAGFGMNDESLRRGPARLVDLFLMEVDSLLDKNGPHPGPQAILDSIRANRAEAEQYVAGIIGAL